MQTTNTFKSIKEMLKSLMEEISNLAEDNANNIFRQQESKLVLQDFIDFLTTHANSTAIVTIHTLKPFCDRLSERWFKIKKNKNLTYLGSSYSAANAAHILFSQCLARHLGMSAWLLLMPTVNGLTHIETSANSEGFQLHQFILGFDEVPINVKKSLEAAADRKSLTLMHTTNPHIPLNHDDAVRVINHSQEARELYAAIEACQTAGQDLKADQDLRAALEKFLNAIKSKNYVMIDANTEYDNASVAKYIIERLGDFEHLAEMLTQSDTTQWITFLNAINDKDLSDMVLKKMSLAKCITKGYTGDVIHDKAVLFCYSEVYWRNRDQGEKYTSALGWLADYTCKTVGGYNKDEKEAAVILFQAFLLSPYDLHELPIFLKKLDMNHVENFLKAKLNITITSSNEQIKHYAEIKELIETAKEMVISALYSGTFSIFPQQLELLIKERQLAHQASNLLQINFHKKRV